MVQRNFRHLTPDVLLTVEPIEADAVAAVATSPGGCDGARYPLFVDLSERPELELSTGDHALLEFILPGRPGRWSAAGQVALALPDGGPGGIPRGLCLELAGLALTQGAASSEPEAAEAAAPAAEEEAAGFDPTGIELGDAEVCGMLSDLLGREVAVLTALGGQVVLPESLADGTYLARPEGWETATGAPWLGSARRIVVGPVR